GGDAAPGLVVHGFSRPAADRHLLVHPRRHASGGGNDRVCARLAPLAVDSDSGGLPRARRLSRADAPRCGGGGRRGAGDLSDRSAGRLVRLSLRRDLARVGPEQQRRADATVDRDPHDRGRRPVLGPARWLHLPPLSAHRRSVARRELPSDPLERRRRAHRMARPLLRYGTARGGCRAYNRLAPFPPSAGFEVGRKSILTSYVDINYRNAPYAKEAPDEALCPPVFVLLPESADR